MNELKVGDRVVHVKYGPGTVVGVGQVGIELGLVLVKLRNVRHRHDPLAEVEMLAAASDLTLEVKP